MPDPNADHDGDLIEDSDVALADYMRRIDAGETVDRDVFIARYAQCADELRDYFDAADDVERMAGPYLISTLHDVDADVDTQVSGVGDSVPDRHAGEKSVVSLPQVFGRYRVEKQLGAGAMGAVYLAHDTQLDRPVALKTPVFDAAADADLIERFYREAKSAANLRHAGICPVFDVGEIDGVHFISMAYIDGKPLSDMVDADQKVPVQTVVSIVCKIAVALDHAHGTGVIHRDLKPANIMIDGQGEPLVMDFGLARRVDTEEQTRITLDGMIIGTPAYMSPEQIEGKQEQIGPPCDVYSLGVILFELLTGRRPFQGTVAAVIGQVMTQEAPAPSQLRHDVDPELDSICAKMMSRRIEDRYTGMAEAEAALFAYLKQFGDKISGVQDVGIEVGEDQTSPETEDSQTPTVLTSGRPPSSGRGKLIGGFAAFGMAVVFGAIIVLRTLYGTLQIEVLEPDVTVLIDDEQIELTDNKWSGWKRARKHGLKVKVGQQTLILGEKTPCTLNGKERLVRLDVEGVTLENDQFEITRNDTTVLTIKLIEMPKESANVSVDSPLPEVFTASAIARNWSEPVNLGPVINSKGQEACPCLSTDGLSLLFSGDRPGGLGKSDLWMCTRTATSEPWSVPTNLGSGVNSDEHDIAPCLSSDELTLLFASDRTGGHGDVDIWMCSRETADDSWSSPINMGTNINSKLKDGGQTLSVDGLTLIFSSYVPGRIVDLFMCTRSSVSQPWSRRRNLESLNSRSIDAGPSLSADGRTLVFCSNREEHPRKKYDLWIATRNSSNEPWSEPMKLRPGINSTHNESSPTLSADGRTLLFRSDRPGGEGGDDLWMSTRLDPPLAKAPFAESEARAHQQAWADYLGLPVEKEVELPGGEKMTFMLIPPGEFKMGSTAEEQTRLLEEAKATDDSRAIDRIPAEGPQHPVRITRPFYMGMYEVTQTQWQAVLGNGPSRIEDSPAVRVAQVSWDDIQSFKAKLNESGSVGQWKFALPTEAQWEYACRAGTTSSWYGGNSEDDLHEDGWFKANSDGKRQPPGQLNANAFGLYDLHGNVWEWCADWYAADYYANSPVDDPNGPSAGEYRVNRGGAWLTHSRSCRSAYRAYFSPENRGHNIGFRLAMTIDLSQLDPVSRPAPQIATDRVPNHALKFDGIDDFVKTPLKYDGTHPITIEAHLTPDRSRRKFGIVTNAELRGLGLYRDGESWRVSGYSAGSKGAPRVSSAGRPELGRRVHVAATYDLKQLTLFVAGQSVGSVDLKGQHLASSLPFFIGADADADRGSYHFRGLIDEVRISKVVRYTQDFKPEENFEPDDETMALYQFDEGLGTIAKDSSKNGFDAKITGATWVNAEGSPADKHGRTAEILFDCPEKISVSAQSRRIVQLDVIRAVDTEPVRVEWSGLPKGTFALPLTIPGGHDAGHAEIYVFGDAEPGTYALELIGTTKDQVATLPVALEIIARSKVEPLKIPTGGLVELDVLAPQTEHEPWKQDGVFASIQGKGTLQFPRMPVDAFALDIELEIRNPASHLVWMHNAPKGSWRSEISVAHLAPPPEKGRVRILPIRRRGGLHFMPGHTYGPLSERFLLTIAATSDRIGIFVNGQLCKSQLNVQSEMHLTLSCLNESADATIYRMAYRPLLAREDIALGVRDLDHPADVMLPIGQWVPLMENEEQFNQWTSRNDEISFDNGTLTLKSSAKRDEPTTSLSRTLPTDLDRFILHVRHWKSGPFFVSETIQIGNHWIRMAHFSADKYELWESGSPKRTDVHQSRAGFEEFADCDYVVIDGQWTAYLNGKQICSRPFPKKSAASFHLNAGSAEGRWRDIAAMRLSDAHVEAIRAGELPKYSAPTGDTALLTPTQILTSPDWEWAEPEPIAEVNSEAREWGPTISGDGLTLVFASVREGGHGSSDLWISERASVTDSWGEPQNLGPQVNGSRVEEYPELSADGLTLLFTRRMPSSADLFVTTRTSRGDPWGAAASLGEPVNTAFNETFPSLTNDGFTLMYSLHWQPGTPGGKFADLRICRRDSLDSPWSEPQDVGEPLNNSGAQKGSCISSDGLTILYSQHQPGSGTDRFMATRDSMTASWNNPVRLPDIFQTPEHDDDIELTSDGREVYLSLDGDIHIIRRVPKQKIEADEESGPDSPFTNADGQDNFAALTASPESDETAAQKEHRAASGISFVEDTESFRRFAEVEDGTSQYTAAHFELIKRLKTETATQRVTTLQEMAALQWPADRFQRDRIPNSALAAAGWGDPARAPAEIVALLGDPTLNCWCVVHDITLTDDGRLMVVARKDGSVSFHDTQTGQLLEIRKCHDAELMSVEVSPDGESLATGGLDGSVTLWNRATGDQIAKHSHQTDWVSDIRFSPDSKRYATSSYDGTVCIYSRERPDVPIHVLPHEDRRVYDVVFVSNELLVTASDDQILRVWNVESGKLQREVDGHSGKVRVLEYSAEADLLASIDTDGKLIVRHTTDWKPAQQLQTTPGTAPFFAMSGNGKAIVVRETKQTLALWDVASGKQTKIWSTPPGLLTIYALAVDPHGRFAVSGNRTGRIRIRDFSKHEDRFANANRLSIPKAALSDNGTQVVLMDPGTHLHTWDFNTHTMRRVRATRSGMVCVDVSADGSTLVTAGTTWKPAVFDIKSGKMLSHPKQGHTNIVHAVAYSHDGSMIASGASDHLIWLWDAKSMAGKATKWERSHRIRSLAFSPDDKLIAHGDKVGGVQVRSSKDGSVVAAFDGKVGECHAVRFTPDGKRVVQGTGDGVIKIWDLDTKKLVSELKGHNQTILSLNFSRDGRTMASSSYDGSIVLWDAQTWKLIRRVELYPFGFGHVYLADFTPDGRHLIATGRNGLAYVLRLSEREQ